ncbi:hypothetical protein H6P81_019563 [Aristolochia fimbriata]|uniref:Uncharacterized protein n=1 Tax=Aristolochia fimbriata TaxID=158543 RepID=A0AAV7DWP3_ARIFI|nr:hypothetical protein H6P81_019563 [Aristolochia fimbriata]
MEAHIPRNSVLVERAFENVIISSFFAFKFWIYIGNYSAMMPLSWEVNCWAALAVIRNLPWFLTLEVVYLLGYVRVLSGLSSHLLGYFTSDGQV